MRAVDVLLEASIPGKDWTGEMGSVGLHFDQQIELRLDLLGEGPRGSNGHVFVHRLAAIRFTSSALDGENSR